MILYFVQQLPNSIKWFEMCHVHMCLIMHPYRAYVKEGNDTCMPVLLLPSWRCNQWNICLQIVELYVEGTNLHCICFYTFKCFSLPFFNVKRLIICSFHFFAVLSSNAWKKESTAIFLLRRTQRIPTDYERVAKLPYPIQGKHLFVNASGLL